MNKFINIRNGKISVTTYRLVECQVTTLDDIITHAVAGWNDYLTATFSADSLVKHPCAYDFLTQYGVKCGSQHGSQPEDTAIFFMFADEEFTFIPADNTVLLG